MQPPHEKSFTLLHARPRSPAAKAQLVLRPFFSTADRVSAEALITAFLPGVSKKVDYPVDRRGGDDIFTRLASEYVKNVLGDKATLPLALTRASIETLKTFLRDQGESLCSPLIPLLFYNRRLKPGALSGVKALLQKKELLSVPGPTKASLSKFFDLQIDEDLFSQFDLFEDKRADGAMLNRIFYHMLVGHFG